MGNTNPVNTIDRGFTGGGATIEDSLVVTDGEPNVESLYKDYLQKRTYGWRLVKRAIRVAKHILFENRTDAVHVNGYGFTGADSNRCCTGDDYQFIIDTVTFIATGKRRYDINTWREILSMPSECTTPLEVKGRSAIHDTFLKYGLQEEPNEILQKWLSHPGGLNDLIITLQLLEGKQAIRW